MIPKYDTDYSLVRETQRGLPVKTRQTVAPGMLMPNSLTAMPIEHGLRVRLDAKMTLSVETARR